VAQSPQRGRDARGVATPAWWAWHKAEQRFDAAGHAEAAAARIETALALFRPDGGLSDRQWAQEHLRAALAALDGPAWGKVRRLLSEQRTLKPRDWAQEQLAQAVAEPLWREACTRLWDWRKAMIHTDGPKHACLAQVVVMEQMVCQRLGPEWPVASAPVDERLRGVVRASRAVECVKSVVRMHQARHRHIRQGMLDLKRRDGNCRTFRHGKRRGACPYELLGLKWPTSDWWTLLQMDPKE
jgi:hypothetical protein